jgi:hypothetical protein
MKGEIIRNFHKSLYTYLFPLPPTEPTAWASWIWFTTDNTDAINTITMQINITGFRGKAGRFINNREINIETLW